MIVSHRHRFVLLVIPEAGNEPIVDLLLDWIGAEDLVVGHGAAGEIRGMPVATTAELPLDAPATLIRQRFPECADYFHVAFVRDPWERAVQAWKSRVAQGAPALTLDEYTQSAEYRALPTNWQQISNGSRLLVDYVGRMESLQTDLLHALRHILGREDITVPLVPPLDRKRFSEEAATRVAAHSADDIRHLRYRFC